MHKKALVVFFFVILAVLLPAAVSRPAQMLSKTILTEITIDKQSDEYVLSGKTVVITPGGNQAQDKKTQDVTATAPSVVECINKIDTETNKKVSFAHCKYIILGQGLKNENIADILRYFLHRTELNNNCFVSWHEKGKRITIEQFFKNYHRYSSSCVLPKGTTETAIFKSGVHAFDLDEVQTDALTILMGKKINKRLVHNGEVLHVTKNTTRIKTKFINKAPVVDISVKMKTRLESNPMASEQAKKNLAAGIKAKIENDIQLTINTLYPTADVFNIYDKFYRRNTHAFKKYLAAKNYNAVMQELNRVINIDILVST